MDAREPGTRRALVAGAALSTAAIVAAGALLWDSSKSGGGTGLPAAVDDPGPIHVHGLGIDPADGALLIATHTGLFRVGANEREASRIGDRFQDTMGFFVAGPRLYLGSGHPDAREDLPPLLGLIKSTDAGETWSSLSLLGEADFHVLRSNGDTIYGYDASNDRLLRSADGGSSWSTATPPAQLVDLAIDPDEPARLVATGVGGLEQGMFVSEDSGAAWERVADAVGLLAWPTSNRLYLVDGIGQVRLSVDGGRTFSPQGSIGGEPAALLGQGDLELYVALHDGTIKRSVDGGRTWSLRSTPS